MKPSIGLLLASLSVTSCDASNSSLISTGGETKAQVDAALEKCPTIKSIFPVAGCNDESQQSDTKE